jgi:hypothetical protein
MVLVGHGKAPRLTQSFDRFGRHFSLPSQDGSTMGGSRMSSLKLYAPQVLSVYFPADDNPDAPSSYAAPPHEAPYEEPVILPFRRDVASAPRNPRFDSKTRSTRQFAAPRHVADLVNRAQQMLNNRSCPDCGRVNVVPVPAAQHDEDRRMMPIPFSGVVVGFSCGCCGHNWSA